MKSISNTSYAEDDGHWKHFMISGYICIYSCVLLIFNQDRRYRMLQLRMRSQASLTVCWVIIIITGLILIIGRIRNEIHRFNSIRNYYVFFILKG